MNKLLLLSLVLAQSCSQGSNFDCSALWNRTVQVIDEIDEVATERTNFTGLFQSLREAEVPERLRRINDVSVACQLGGQRALSSEAIWSLMDLASTIEHLRPTGDAEVDKDQREDFLQDVAEARAVVVSREAP